MKNIKLDKYVNKVISNSYKITNIFTRESNYFTQGLLYINGSFYESTGFYGKSKVLNFKLNKDNNTIQIINSKNLDNNLFGEGLEVLCNNDNKCYLYQLTYHERKMYNNKISI